METFIRRQHSESIAPPQHGSASAANGAAPSSSQPLLVSEAAPANAAGQSSSATQHTDLEHRHEPNHASSSSSSSSMSGRSLGSELSGDPQQGDAVSPTLPDSSKPRDPQPAAELTRSEQSPEWQPDSRLYRRLQDLTAIQLPGQSNRMALVFDPLNDPVRPACPLACLAQALFLTR